MSKANADSRPATERRGTFRLGDGIAWYRLFKGTRCIAEFDGSMTREEMQSIADSLNADYAESAQVSK